AVLEQARRRVEITPGCHHRRTGAVGCGQHQTTDRFASASGRGRYAGGYVGRARAREAVAQRFWGERLRSRSIVRALSAAGPVAR
ncbi:unnamed protein product, partial [Ascophyllum nodosum]